MRGIRKHLIKRTRNHEHTYVAELSAYGNSVPKMDHLVRGAATSRVFVDFFLGLSPSESSNACMHSGPPHIHSALEIHTLTCKRMHKHTYTRIYLHTHNTRVGLFLAWNASTRLRERARPQQHGRVGFRPRTSQGAAQHAYMQTHVCVDV